MSKEIIAKKYFDESERRSAGEPWPFSEEHGTFRRTVKSFAERAIMPHVEEWERQETIPRELFEKMAEAGYLVPAVRGEKIGALAITEAGAGSDAAGIATTARWDAEGFCLSGTKTFVTNGMTADFVVVAARTDPGAGRHGISLLIVERGSPGFPTARKLRKLGWQASETAELALEACVVPASNLLGEGHRGVDHLMENAQWERLLVALQSVVTAEVALEAALAHARARVQFGKPLIEFQAIRHRLAECAADIEVARALTYYALDFYDQHQECIKEAATAKLVATEVACRVTDEALQVHGGYGYMMEYPIQRLWRDARLGRIGGGTSEIMAEVIADRLGLPREQPDHRAGTRR